MRSVYSYVSVGRRMSLLGVFGQPSDGSETES